MAVNVSDKKLNLSNKGLGKRKGSMDNPVEDMLGSSNVRIKRYDKRKLDINNYISREEIEAFKRLPPAKQQQMLSQFFNTPEYRNIEKLTEVYRQKHVIRYNVRDGIKLSRTKNVLDDKIQYINEYKSPVRIKQDTIGNNIPQSRETSISLSEKARDEVGIKTEKEREHINEAGELGNCSDDNKKADISSENEEYQIDDVPEKEISLSSSDNKENAGIKKNRKSRIRLSEDNNTKEADTVNSKKGSHSGYIESKSYTDENKYTQYTNTYNSMPMQDGQAVSAATAGTDGAKAAGEAASSAGTSEIIRAAEKAVKKYADTISQAVNQEQESDNSGSNNNADTGEVKTESTGIMNKIATVALTAVAVVISYIGAAIMPIIAILMCVIVIATMIISVIGSVIGAITNTASKTTIKVNLQQLSDNTISYTDDLREAAEDNGILDYVNYLMAIMEVESHGTGNDPMQSSESAGLPPNGFDNPRDSINQGVYYFAYCVNKAKDMGCDVMSAVQSYNYGSGFINYVAENGGTYTLELAISFAEEYSGGVQVDYSNPIAVEYNGGWRYAYGNMFYAQLVKQYINQYQSATAQKVIDEAMKYNGWEYTWGGSSPDEGFDCSGLVQYCYGVAGIDLPRTSREQWAVCEEISMDDIVPGDLLFYQNETSNGEIGHVAIYIGDGKVFEAGDPIGIYDNNSTWHQENLLHAGRVIDFESEDNESDDEQDEEEPDEEETDDESESDDE